MKESLLGLQLSYSRFFFTEGSIDDTNNYISYLDKNDRNK